MDSFPNVEVVKKANIYFEGKVTSRTIIFNHGERKTLGIMMPGEYEFGTAAKELMEIITGKLAVMLPGKNEWLNFGSDQSFEVPANSKFKLKVTELVDYCCSYLQD